VVLDCREAASTWEWQPQTKLWDILEEIACFADTENDWLNVAK
jgi:hypothetical protein